jgi:hypothetical protein
MNNVKNMGIERILDELRTLLTGDSRPEDLPDLRRILQDIIFQKFTGEDGESRIAAEVYDAGREKITLIRMPHAHRIRDPYGVNGASLSEVMESVDLMAITASSAIRSVVAEVAHQEEGRQWLARHIVSCTQVRLWGEALAEERPHLSRMLITFASEGTAPRVIDADDARRLGFDPEYFQSLLDPENFDILKESLIAMAEAKIGRNTL